MARQVAIGFAALIVGFLIGCAAGIYAQRQSETRSAVPTDLASLRATPDRFSGKLVRVTGKLDECYSWECSLCPESMSRTNVDPKKCAALEFRSLVPDTGFGEQEQEKLFRFATVTLLAKFDPTCWKFPCLDRGTVLENAAVEKIGGRPSSRDGLWLGGFTKLHEASAPLAGNIINEARRAGFPDRVSRKVFSVEGDQNVAVVCWTSVDSWPTTLEGALYAKSTADFYTCREARMSEGAWTIQAQDDS